MQIKDPILKTKKFHSIDTFKPCYWVIAPSYKLPPLLFVNNAIRQRERLAGEVVQILKFGELVVTAEVRIVGGQRHQEVHEADDDDEAGNRR